MSKVIVVDDDPEVRALCRMILGGEGYEVLDARDAPTGVALAGAELPDLVLMDIMMPGMDGLDALESLKKDQRTRGIPVVMLTALDGLPQVTSATHCGADGYMTKPFEVEDLLSVVFRFVDAPVSTG